MSAEEALLIEFDTEPESDTPATPTTNSSTDVRSRMDAIFAEVTASTSMTPLLSNMSIGERAELLAQPAANNPVPQPAANKPLPLPTASKPLPLPTAKKSANKHARFPSRYPLDINTVKIITNGRSMLALYGDETVPRTKDRLLVEDHDDNGNIATTILDARVTLQEVCTEYPAFVRGTLLRVFSCEGWSSELIWKNLPAETRQVSDGDCPWAWLDEALDREMARMDVAESEEPAKKKMKTSNDAHSEAQSDSSPSKNTGFNFQAPHWTLTDDRRLVQLKEHERKSYKAIAEELGRSISACTSRYSKLNKQREAAAAAVASSTNTATAAVGTGCPDGQPSSSTTPADGNVDVAVVVGGTEPLPSSQNAEAMVVD